MEIFFSMGSYWEAQGGQLARFKAFWEKEQKKKFVHDYLYNFFAVNSLLNYVFEGKIYIR